MAHSFRHLFIALTAILLLPTGIAWGQVKPVKPKPAPKAPPVAKAPATPKTPPSGDHAAATPKPKKPDAPPPSTDEGVSPIPPDDPAVLSVLESKPTTPSELLKSVDMLLQLGQSKLARPFLEKLTAAKLDAAAMAGLVQEFGGGLFLQLAVNSDLQPEGKAFSDAATKAADKLNHDPQRLRGYIAALGDPSIDRRREALGGLLAGQTDAAAMLIGVMADGNQAAHHSAVRDALTIFGSDAIPLLMAATTSTDDALRSQAIEMLGRLRAVDSVAMLAGWSLADGNPAVRAAAETALRQVGGANITRAAAESLLAREAKEYFDNQRPFETTLEGGVEYWNWDEKLHLPFLKVVSPEMAAATLAASRAELLAAVSDRPENRQFALAAGLEAAAYRVGLDKQLTQPTKYYGTAYEAAVKQGPEALQRLLSFTLNAGHPVAGTAAARILGEIGTPQLLIGRAGTLSPLAIALRHSDRRLRFAALEAVMSLDPTAPYPGSSYVPEALGYFANSFGAKKAIVAHPRSEVGSQLAGFLGGLGYETDVVTNGQDLLRRAAASPDYELVLVSATIDHLPAEPVLQTLQNDPRTARLPVGVLSELATSVAESRFAGEQPNAIVADRPSDLASMKHLVGELTSRRVGTETGADQRLHEAGQAVAWISQLSGGRQSLYDLRRLQGVLLSALDMPPLATETAKALGNLGTHEAQVALTDLAGRGSRPLAVRQAASAAFANNVDHYGLRLTSDEILRQYDRYNQSAKLDAGTQKVLAAVLDAIEAPSKKRSP